MNPLCCARHKLTQTHPTVKGSDVWLTCTLSPDLIKKTILVKQADLAPDINTVEKIRSIYSNKIEIVSEDEIVKAIESKAPETVILHKVGPAGKNQGGYCFKMLIGTDDANMYYYNVHKIDKNNPDGLLRADLSRLARFD